MHGRTGSGIVDLEHIILPGNGNEAFHDRIFGYNHWFFLSYSPFASILLRALHGHWPIVTSFPPLGRQTETRSKLSYLRGTSLPIPLP